MKKIVLLFILALTTRVNAQSEQQCFTGEKKMENSLEKITVILVKTGNNVEVEVRKNLVKGKDDYSCSWEMEGVINGDKIIFNVPKGTVDHFKQDSNPIEGPETVETWVMKDGKLLINEQTLKPGECK